MALEERNGKWFDTVSRRYYEQKPFAKGDMVRPIVNNLANVTLGKTYEIEDARISSSLYTTFRDEQSNAYQYAYEQKLVIKDDRGFRKEVRSKNFTPSKEAPVSSILAIETNRPTVVVEIVEKVVDGKTVIEEIGDPVGMESLSAARVYTTNAISEAIRKDNTYKQFRIYQEVSIARAKKPEIEFA